MRFRFFKTIAFRLTAWYAGIFIVSSLIMFLMFSFFFTKTMLHKIDLDLEENLKVFSGVISREGMGGAKRFAITKARSAGEKIVFYRLLYPTGEVFASSRMLYWNDIKADKNILNRVILEKRNFFQTIEQGSRDEDIRVIYGFIAQGVILQSGISMGTYSKFLNIFIMAFPASMGFIILFSAVTGWFLAKKALSGVGQIIKIAKKVSHTEQDLLDSRVPLTGTGDELDLLAQTFNQMLDRIEKLITGIKEMGDNIAHDLKSPVARIRGLAEITMLESDTIDEYKKMASSTIEESDRLIDMINTMLLISKARSGNARFKFEKLDISEMINSACELFGALAEENNITFKYQIEDSIIIKGDKKMLQRAFSNILDNAFKYTPGGKSIDVLVEQSHSKIVVIKVTDTGRGIDAFDLDKIFKRFYRADTARSEQGSGLGLALALAIVKEHGGNIDVASEKGSGSRFTITLPNGNL